MAGLTEQAEPLLHRNKWVADLVKDTGKIGQVINSRKSDSYELTIFQLDLVTQLACDAWLTVKLWQSHTGMQQGESEQSKQPASRAEQPAAIFLLY